MLKWPCNMQQEQVGNTMNAYHPQGSSPTTDILRLLRNSVGAELEDFSTLTSYSRKEMIFKPGDEERNVYIIQQGRVRLFRQNPSGKDITLNLLDDNELFGEMALFFTGQRINAAAALEETRIYVISIDVFKKWMQDVPELSQSVLLLMADRRRIMEQKATEFAIFEVSQRVARTILQLFARYNGYPNEQSKSINVRITQGELASIAGTTRESATCQLNNFRREGFIEIVDRRIVLLDRTALQRVADNNL